MNLKFIYGSQQIGFTIFGQRFLSKQGNDGYLYLFIDEQTPYIWKKVQIGVKAVGNILQSTQCMMFNSPFYESISC